MIPKYPFKYLIPGDFPVYAGRREDEADCEPLWQPLYDSTHCSTAGGLNRRSCNRKQLSGDKLPEGKPQSRPDGL